jgi:hypothetical protein
MNNRYARVMHWSYWSPQKISFFEKRKEWAHELFARSGEPYESGRTVEGTFQGLPYMVRIGPRGGLQIDGSKPEYFLPGGTACWLDEKGEPHLYPKTPDGLVKLPLPELAS